MQVAEPELAPERVHRVYWWKEALIVAVFYAIYTWTRNQFGSNQIAADGVPEQAFTNAERVIRLEEWLHLYVEPTIQDWFLPYRTFIQFWNVFYGTAHFFVTLGVFVLLYVKRSDVFPLWRNTLAAMTALAIVGFAFFPLMPPRLLDEPCPAEDPSEYGADGQRRAGMSGDKIPGGRNKPTDRRACTADARCSKKGQQRRVRDDR